MDMELVPLKMNYFHVVVTIIILGLTVNNKFKLGHDYTIPRAHKYKEQATSVDGPYRSKFHFSEVGVALFQLCYSL